MAKQPVEGQDNRLATDYVLFTAAHTVRVKPLPPHPLRDMVPVGQFRLTESLRPAQVHVNEPARFQVQLSGPGNLAAVRLPDPLPAVPGLNTYRPRVRTQAAWPPAGPGATGGTKTFSWDVLPEQAGSFRLDSLVMLVYFDPALGRYDTLRATERLRVTPQTRTMPSGSAAAPWAGDPFYDRIEQESLTPVAAPEPAALRRYANLVLLVLAGVGGWVLWQRRRAENQA